MPLVTDPLGTRPAAPTTVVSTDNRLTAVLDATHPGVWLRPDGSAMSPVPPRWRITRRNPDGSELLVRSADPVWSPGGIGVAYDDESPLSATVRYTATPEYDDDTTPVASVVTVTTGQPGITHFRDVWLSSIELPDLSALVLCSGWPDLSYKSSTTVATPVGSRFPAVAINPHAASVSTMSVLAEGSEVESLRALLTSDDVMLVRTIPGYHRPDAYVAVGDVTESVMKPTRSDVDWRAFTFDLTEVARPGTADQPLRVPGWSNAIVAANLADYGTVATGFPSWQALASNGVFNGQTVPELTLTDLGAGRFALAGTAVVDNDDGTATISGSGVTDNGDGTATIGAA